MPSVITKLDDGRATRVIIHVLKRAGERPPCFYPGVSIKLFTAGIDGVGVHWAVIKGMQRASSSSNGADTFIKATPLQARGAQVTGVRSTVAPFFEGEEALAQAAARARIITRHIHGHRNAIDHGIGAGATKKEITMLLYDGGARPREVSNALEIGDHEISRAGAAAFIKAAEGSVCGVVVIRGFFVVKLARVIGIGIGIGMA